jgi:phytanoyl-CoA hydroxylase
MIASSQRKILKKRFDEQGYVVIRGFLSGQAFGILKQELDRYIHECAPELPREDVLYEDPNSSETLKQLARMKQNDPFFDDLLQQAQWIGLAETLLADKVVPQEVEWFNKPPKIGKATPAHQDGYYFMLEPNEAVTMWLALDPVDESNGCMRYLAGSHRRGLRPHTSTQVVGFSQGIVDYGEMDRQAEVPIHAEPGDLLVHHALTIHRADDNRSDRHRRSLGFIFYSAHAQQDKKRLAAYQNHLYEQWSANKRI